MKLLLPRGCGVLLTKRKFAVPGCEPRCQRNHFKTSNLSFPNPKSQMLHSWMCDWTIKRHLLGPKIRLTAAHIFFPGISRGDVSVSSSNPVPFASSSQGPTTGDPNFRLAQQANQNVAFQVQVTITRHYTSNRRVREVLCRLSLGFEFNLEKPLIDFNYPYRPTQ